MWIMTDKNRLQKIIEAAEQLGLAIQVVEDEDGICAVLMGDPSYVNSVTLEDIFKTKDIH
jgi:fructose-1,6-bisphosphatase/sedoheptulose 1,7-bisphosphatase-like protein